MVEMADPHVRLRKKLRASDHEIPVCTPNYRPPDVTLGSQRWGEDFDMWSFGCVAAELYSGQMLIAPAATAEQAPSGKDFVDAIAAIVGRPSQEADAAVMPACAASWLDELPFFNKWYQQSGQAWLTASAETAKAWPPSVPRRLPRRPRPARPKVFGVAPVRQNDCHRGKNQQLLAAAWSVATACPPGRAARQERRRNYSAGRPRTRFAPLFANVPELEQPCQAAPANASNRLQVRPSGGGGTGPQNRVPRHRG